MCDSIHTWNSYKDDEEEKNKENFFTRITSMIVPLAEAQL